MNPHCDRCKGAGFYTFNVPVTHPQFGVLQRCSCNTEGLQRKGNIKPDQTFQTFTKEHCPAVVYRVQQYANNPQGLLYLWGSTGNGKTHLAYAVANYFISVTLKHVYFESPTTWL